MIFKGKDTSALALLIHFLNELADGGGKIGNLLFHCLHLVCQANRIGRFAERPHEEKVNRPDGENLLFRQRNRFVELLVGIVGKQGKRTVLVQFIFDPLYKGAPLAIRYDIDFTAAHMLPLTLVQTTHDHSAIVI